MVLEAMIFIDRHLFSRGALQLHQKRKLFVDPSCLPKKVGNFFLLLSGHHGAMSWWLMQKLSLIHLLFLYQFEAASFLIFCSILLQYLIV